MEQKRIVFETDARLIVNSWDDASESLTGRAPVDALGKKYYTVVPRILSNNRDAVVAVIKSGKPVAIHGHYFNCLSGKVKADISISPLTGAGVVAGASVAIGVTAPDQYEKLNNNQQLIDIGRVATTFAHSVRNPLNAIKGAVVYLSTRYSKEDTLIEFTQIIEDEISRLDDFISRFLSSYVSEAEFKETDLNAIIEKVEIFTSLQTHSRGVESEYLYGEIPPVFVNPFQIEQAILNVVNNAIQALGAGGKLRVRTLHEAGQEGGGFAVVEVADTGPGMSASTAHGLEKPFKKNKGRGFGLFITSEILRQLGGRMEIKSGEGGTGTTVRLFVPAAGRGGFIAGSV